MKAILHKAKIVKAGNSFAIRIPKALLDTEVLKEDAEYEIEIREGGISNPSRVISHLTDSSLLAYACG